MTKQASMRGQEESIEVSGGVKMEEKRRGKNEQNEAIGKIDKRRRLDLFVLSNMTVELLL